MGDPYPESIVRKRAVAAYFSSPRAKGIDPRANWPATGTAGGRRRPRFPDRCAPPAWTPRPVPLVVTQRGHIQSFGSVAVRFTVDIAGIRGKLLSSPAPGSLAGPAGSSGSGYVLAGAPAASRPWVKRGTRTGRKGLLRSSGWTGGWAWKGPGHPVDNGDQARGQRDSLRSEGAARVLFLRGKAGNRARTDGSGTNLRTGSLFAVNQCSAGGKQRAAASGEIAVNRRRPVRGYHGLHCP